MMNNNDISRCIEKEKEFNDKFGFVDKPKNMTEAGGCSNCGKCCTEFLPMNDKEIADIKMYMKKHKVIEQRHNVMMGVDMTCPFRDNAQKKCLIYEVRPEICRKFICSEAKDKADYDKYAILLNGRRKILARQEFFENNEFDERFLLSLAFGMARFRSV